MAYTETIDHRTVAQAVRAGAVRGAHVVGQPGGWGVVFHYGQATPMLAAKRGEARTFARLETLVEYLKELGILKFEVDASSYDPDRTSRPRMRADAAERLPHAHQAAAHDKWFRAEVEKALEEADDPNTECVARGGEGRLVQTAREAAEADQGRQMSHITDEALIHAADATIRENPTIGQAHRLCDSSLASTTGYGYAFAPPRSSREMKLALAHFRK